MSVGGWTHIFTSELITLAPQGLSDVENAKKQKTVLVNVQAKRQASVVFKLQTLGLSSLTTKDVVIILEQVYCEWGPL